MQVIVIVQIVHNSSTNNPKGREKMKEKWVKWFAWYPVEINQYVGYVWLRFVWRIRICDYSPALGAWSDWAYSERDCTYQNDCDEQSDKERHEKT